MNEIEDDDRREEHAADRFTPIAIPCHFGGHRRIEQNRDDEKYTNAYDLTHGLTF
ncbi:hypothetical protein RRH01S_01_00190 [Rhizobium rhizogenes NBRC 13257]|uniref:Uncharacterized protein n=1 Tax=Rhizobium rhizogenes NBRC 13257 TaxID=1220581 RepID=A0AA87PU72_RHIRH|nr:hypothetical protein RRH01S_01_00190 [Rhizobium rhizogenes NBRC 13257]